MKRWQNIVAVGGFLIVLAFVAERFFSVRAPLAGLSWADLRDFGHDLVGIALVYAGITAILLAIFAIPYLLWTVVLRKPQKNGLPEPQYPFAGQVRHVVEIAVLSAFIGSAATIAAFGGNWIGAPGWWVAVKLNTPPRRDLSLSLFFGSAIIVNSAICFAILWGGYLLWQRDRQKPAQTSVHHGN